jgi:hypothetical protein
MWYKSKYVILDQAAACIPIVFGDMITHSDMECLGGKVIGAGFCYINEKGLYECYGESVSCKVKSRGEQDAKILNKFLGVTHEE